MPSPAPIRILFFADSHLGIDLPLKPRIERRRRGHDFFANYEGVLAMALEERVDLIVHGGDLFYRSKIPASLVQQAFLPLKRVADAGIPIVVVPGNHERSKIPYPLLAEHPAIHIFHAPTTFVMELRGQRVALAGFPYHPRDVRSSFPDLVNATGWRKVDADLHLLVVHHCFEGATVGPADYVFRFNDDVIRHRDVPPAFAAVLTGHVHRHQALTRDLLGRSLATPVLYPGSIERTSFAEMGEPKGYFMLTSHEPGSIDWQFRHLPARPMVSVDIDGKLPTAEALEHAVCSSIAGAPEDAVLRIRVLGTVPAAARSALRAGHVRDLTPPTMNVEIVLPDERRAFRAGSQRST